MRRFPTIHGVKEWRCQLLAVIFLICSFFSTPGFSQTWNLLSPYPTAEQISRIYFYNSNLGFCVTSNGFIVRTSDGGATWTQIYAGHPDVIHGIYFTDANTGYACGYRKWILKTTDGGLTWTDLNYEASSSVGYQSVVFSDANTGYVVGNGGVFLKTVNAGANWSSLSTGYSFEYEKILYIGSNTLLIFGGNQYILRSTNSGTSWNQIDSKVVFSKMGAHSPDNTNIFASCLSGYFTKSTDGGLTWSGGLTGVTDKHMYAIYFTSATTGYIANQYGGIWKTTNAGSSWTTQTSGVSNAFYGIAFTDGNKGFMGGAQGLLMVTTDGGGSWNTVNRGLSFSINAAHFMDANTGFVASYDGQGIYKTTNGGSDWTNVTSTVGQGGIYDFLFADSQYGYAVGYDADWATVFIKSTDGGAVWSQTNINATGIYGPISLSFPSTSTGYLIGDNSSYNKSILAKTTDYGATWTVLKSDFTTLFSCWFTDANTGYVCGANGYAAKTTDGGSSWTPMTTNTTNYLKSVTFYNSSLGYMCGQKGTILKTTDGGSSWSDISVPTTNALNKIRFAYEDVLVTCGSGGAVYLSKNGGESWANQSVSCNPELYTIGISGTSGWVFGGSGAIYKADSPLPVELTSLTASAGNNGVNICWRTATELNNFGFEIERAVVGSEFRVMNYEKIGFVAGAGNSSSPNSYTYCDNNTAVGKYSYRLKQIDNDGHFEYSGVVEVSVNNFPGEYSLSQNYPNPFNPSTVIKYQLPEAAHVTLKVYDVLGKEVTTLVNGFQQPGNYNCEFRIRSSELSSGVYIARLNAGKFTKSIRMQLLK